MSTVEHCRAMAAEADRLATLVSYTRDKVRLREQAETWMRKAAELEAKRTAEAVDGASSPGLMNWLRRRVG